MAMKMEPGRPSCGAGAGSRMTQAPACTRRTGRRQCGFQRDFQLQQHGFGVGDGGEGAGDICGADGAVGARRLDDRVLPILADQDHAEGGRGLWVLSEA